LGFFFSVFSGSIFGLYFSSFLGFFCFGFSGFAPPLKRSEMGRYGAFSSSLSVHFFIFIPPVFARILPFN